VLTLLSGVEMNTMAGATLVWRLLSLRPRLSGINIPIKTINEEIHLAT